MPTPPKRIENQRKHLTQAEKSARVRAERGMRRNTRVKLRVPKWLSVEAKKVWRETLKRLQGIELLDNVDAELLGIYCDAVAKYRAMSKQLDKKDEEGNPVVADNKTIEKAQAWARLISMYAEKLGLSPNARARLAKKKAQIEQPDEMDKLLSDVRDFVNDDQGQGNGT